MSYNKLKYIYMPFICTYSYVCTGLCIFADGLEESVQRRAVSQKVEGRVALPLPSVHGSLKVNAITFPIATGSARSFHIITLKQLQWLSITGLYI